MATFGRSAEKRAVKSARALGYPTLRDQQLQVITSFVRKSDVFAVLPYGYAKSLCHALLLLTSDYSACAMYIHAFVYSCLDFSVQLIHVTSQNIPRTHLRYQEGVATPD